MDLYSIGKVSKMCNIPIKTLRFYDQIGLLMPERISDKNNYRYYSQKSIMQIAIIKYFKTAGFTLEEIKEILNRTDNEVLEKYLSNKLIALNDELANINKRIAAVLEWNNLLGIGKTNYAKRSLPVEVTTAKIPLYRVLKLDYHFDTFTNFAEIIYRISNEFTIHCDRQEFLNFGSFIAYFPNSQSRMMDLLKDAIFYSELVATSSANKATERIGNIKALKAIHIGSYSSINNTYQIIYNWAETHDIKLQKDSYEKYIIDPWSSYSADSYITEIMIPMQEKN